MYNRSEANSFGTNAQTQTQTQLLPARESSNDRAQLRISAQPGPLYNGWNIYVHEELKRYLYGTDTNGPGYAEEEWELKETGWFQK